MGLSHSAFAYLVLRSTNTPENTPETIRETMPEITPEPGEGSPEEIRLRIAGENRRSICWNEMGNGDGGDR